MNVILIFFRCWNIWSSLGLYARKKRLLDSSLLTKCCVWLLNSISPRLLDLSPTSSPHRFQHWWRWPLRLCSCYRACRILETWCGWHVHILFFLNWNSNLVRYSLHFPLLAGAVHCLVYPLYPFPCHCSAFYL